MKKSMVLAALLMVFAGHPASAHVVPAGGRPVGYCAIQGQLTISSGALGIAVSSAEGFGRVVCDYRNGSQEIMPILLEANAIGLGIQLPETVMARVFAPGFAVTEEGAVGLLGTYGVIRSASGARYTGEIGLDLTVSETGATIPAVLQLENGHQALAATLGIGEVTLRFDPRNLQARHVHQLPVQHPRRPNQHLSPGHHHHKEAKAAPLPPERPEHLGEDPASVGAATKKDAPDKKPAAPSPGPSAKPSASASPAPAATQPAAPAPAAGPVKSAVPAESDAEPVSREI